MRSMPAFLAIVPGSQSFTIPTTNVTNMTGSISGFSWTPSSQMGSELVFVGGEPGGLAVAQNVSNTVIQSANTNCSGGTAPISDLEISSSSVSATSQAPTGSSTAFGSHTTSSVDAGGRENDG